MTYDEIMANEAIEFIILRPGLNNSGLSILRKRSYDETVLEGYTYKGVYDHKGDAVEFIKNG